MYTSPSHPPSASVSVECVFALVCAPLKMMKAKHGRRDADSTEHTEEGCVCVRNAGFGVRVHPTGSLSLSCARVRILRAPVIVIVYVCARAFTYHEINVCETVCVWRICVYGNDGFSRIWICRAQKFLLFRRTVSSTKDRATDANKQINKRQSNPREKSQHFIPFDYCIIRYRISRRISCPKSG